ncbi:unnamed protein product [Musa acuminata var. zebrina]
MTTVAVDAKPSPPAPLASIVASAPLHGDDDVLYGRLKSLQRQLEFIEIQDEYVKDEQKNLKRPRRR